MADSIQVYKRTPERDRILTAVPRRSHVPTGNKVQNVSTKRKAAEGGMWQCSVTRFPNAEATEEDKHNWYLDITWQGRESVLEGDMYKGVVGRFICDKAYYERRKTYNAYYNYDSDGNLINRLKFGEIRPGHLENFGVYYCILTGEFTVGASPETYYESFFIHIANVLFRSRMVDDERVISFEIIQYTNSEKEVVYNAYNGSFSARITNFNDKDVFQIKYRFGGLRMSIVRGSGDIKINIKPGAVYVDNKLFGTYGTESVYLKDGEKFVVLVVDKKTGNGTFKAAESRRQFETNENSYVFYIASMFDNFSVIVDTDYSFVLSQMVANDIYFFTEKPSYQGEFQLVVESVEKSGTGGITATNIRVDNGITPLKGTAGRILWAGKLLKKVGAFTGRIEGNPRIKFVWLKATVTNNTVNTSFEIRDTDEPPTNKEREDYFDFWWMIGVVENGVAYQAHYYGPIVITDRLFDVTDKEEDDSK